jgi:ribosomal protein S18 acetylase RimI-like enzyme
MAAPVEVRPVRETDAAALVPLFRAFFAEHFGEDLTAETVSRRLRRVSRAETFLVAASGGRIVGFTSLRVVPSIDPTPHAEVTDLFVAEDARRQGIGTALLRQCEAIARSRGAASLVLLTGRENREAKAFYRALGYESYALAVRKSLKR